MSQRVVYVAGPMSGYPDYNYPAFRGAAARLKKAGWAVLNPVDSEKWNPTPGTFQPWDWYMRHALRMVLAADGVALLPGWLHSQGVTLELTVAKALGLTIAPLEYWLGGLVTVGEDGKLVCPAW